MHRLLRTRFGCVAFGNGRSRAYPLSRKTLLNRDMFIVSYGIALEVSGSDIPISRQQNLIKSIRFESVLPWNATVLPRFDHSSRRILGLEKRAPDDLCVLAKPVMVRDEHGTVQISE